MAAGGGGAGFEDDAEGREEDGPDEDVTPLLAAVPPPAAAAAPGTAEDDVEPDDSDLGTLEDDEVLAGLDVTLSIFDEVLAVVARAGDAPDVGLLPLAGTAVCPVEGCAADDDTVFGSAAGSFHPGAPLRPDGSAGFPLLLTGAPRTSVAFRSSSGLGFLPAELELSGFPSFLSAIVSTLELNAYCLRSATLNASVMIASRPQHGPRHQPIDTRFGTPHDAIPQHLPTELTDSNSDHFALSYTKLPHQNRTSATKHSFQAAHCSLASCQRKHFINIRGSRRFNLDRLQGRQSSGD